jgi:glycosyltransferase involved in cell wall biosynthesis
MKIAYATTFDAKDILSWSGIGYYLGECLKAQATSVAYLGPLKEKYSWFFKGKQFFYKYLLGKRHLRDREPVIVKSYAAQIARKLAGLKADLVLSPSAIPIAYLECREPLVLWTDGSFRATVDFYPEFSNLSRETMGNGHALEAAAMERVKLAIFSSDWAAAAAMRDYRVDPAKVRVVPYGANLSWEPGLTEITAMISRRPPDRCRLLFIGVAWWRKGGDRACEVARELNKRGLPTELIVVGCRPPGRAPPPEFVTFTGFLNKALPAEAAAINRWLARSHFLLLPARAEAAAVVLAEANSFGVPCLTTDVGGLTTIIKNGVNGRTFPQAADISEYCDYICHLFANYHEYGDLALSAFHQYQSRLNWNTAGQAVRELLLAIL